MDARRKEDAEVEGDPGGRGAVFDSEVRARAAPEPASNLLNERSNPPSCTACLSRCLVTQVKTRNPRAVCAREGARLGVDLAVSSHSPCGTPPRSVFPRLRGRHPRKRSRHWHPGCGSGQGREAKGSGEAVLDFEPLGQLEGGRVGVGVGVGIPFDSAIVARYRMPVFAAWF